MFSIELDNVDAGRGALLPVALGLPMKIQMHRLSLQQIPADLFADPDGGWSYEVLVSAAGLDPDAVPSPIVAALAEPWGGHPEGAAVVAASGENDPYVAIIECDPFQGAGPLERAA